MLGYLSLRVWSCLHLSCRVFYWKYTPREIHTKPHPRLEWRIFHILTSEDIDAFADIKFVSSIVLKFVGVWSKHLRVFLESPRQFSAICGHFRKMFGNVLATFGQNFSDLRKIVNYAVIRLSHKLPMNPKKVADKRGVVRGFLVKRDRVFLFSVIRYYKEILSLNCEWYALHLQGNRWWWWG